MDLLLACTWSRTVGLHRPTSGVRLSGLVANATADNKNWQHHSFTCHTVQSGLLLRSFPPEYTCPTGEKDLLLTLTGAGCVPVSISLHIELTANTMQTL